MIKYNENEDIKYKKVNIVLFNRIKITMDKVTLTEKLKKFIFTDFKTILSYSIIPYGMSNLQSVQYESFINFSDSNEFGGFNHIYAKLNISTPGHLSMICIIGLI